MKLYSRLASVAAFLGLFCVFAVPAGAAPVIKSQAPCSSTTFCLQFTNTGTIPVIRSFTFTAPSVGTAEVSFHGALVCSDVNISQRNPVVVDLVSEIVTASNATPSATMPGGLRHAVVWEPIILNVLFTGFTQSFNLASTRVVSVTSAGNKNFFFKIARLRMDPDTSCVVYNAAFSVVFIP